MLVYPTEIWLWIAVNRVGAREDVRELAGALACDTKSSPALQCAAALVARRDHPHLDQRVLEIVRLRLDEFACFGCTLPLAEPTPEFATRYSEANTMIHVFNEMPSEWLEAHMRELVAFGGSEFGNAVYHVLGKRAPVRFLAELSRSKYLPVDAGAHPALAALVLRVPELAGPVGALVPAQELEDLLEELRKESATMAGVPHDRSMKLWGQRLLCRQGEAQ